MDRLFLSMTIGGILLLVTALAATPQHHGPDDGLIDVVTQSL